MPNRTYIAYDEKSMLRALADDLSSDDNELRENVPSTLFREICAKWGECSYFWKNFIRKRY